MSESERTPGASPAEGLASEQDGSKTTTPGGLPDVVASQQVKKLRDEAAKYRTERNDLRARLDALEAQQKQANAERAKAEEARLAEQGKFEDLFKKEQARNKAAAERLIDAELRQRLAAKGVTDEKQQKMLLPALRGSVAASVADDFSVTGNFDDAIAEAVEAFGLGQAPVAASEESKAEPPAAPQLNQAALLLSQNLPKGEAKNTGDVWSQFGSALLK